MVFKYYSTQRPIDIGTYPKLPNDPQVEMTFFSGRQPVESGTVLAWGVLAYNAPLSPKQIEDYELRPARDNCATFIRKVYHLLKCGSSKPLHSDC